MGSGTSYSCGGMLQSPSRSMLEVMLSRRSRRPPTVEGAQGILPHLQCLSCGFSEPQEHKNRGGDAHDHQALAVPLLHREHQVNGRHNGRARAHGPVARYVDVACGHHPDGFVSRRLTFQCAEAR